MNNEQLMIVNNNRTTETMKQPLFESPVTENAARAIAKAMAEANASYDHCGGQYVANQSGLYGILYDALKRLLSLEFSEEIASDAMNDDGWCYTSWDGACVPSIETAIAEAEENVPEQPEPDARLLA